MSKHDFGYFFHEGLSNMFSHGFMSFAAIGITVACLLIMGTFTLVAVNADANLKQAEQDNEILAFVDDSYTEAQAKALQKKLEAVDNVASVTFISREEAMQSFISEHPDEEYFQDLDPNILRDRFAIKVKELKLQSQTVELIKAIPGIGGINPQRAFGRYSHLGLRGRHLFNVQALGRNRHRTFALKGGVTLGSRDLLDGVDTRVHTAQFHMAIRARGDARVGIRRPRAVSR